MWFSLVNDTGVKAAGGENFSRGDSLDASAHWNASGVNSSYVWLNASGAVAEYAFAHADENDNWTNVTLDFSNYTLFPRAGNVSVRLLAYDTFFQQNYTASAKWFYLWGSANVSFVSLNGSIYDDNTTIANGTYHAARCLVSDEDSGYALSGYNVSFYVNASYAGSSLSNSTGWASLSFIDNSTTSGSYDLRCNITGQQDLYYIQGSGSGSNMTVNILTDTDSPYFTDHWFEHLGQRVNGTNLYRNASIVVSAADGTTSVASVTAEVNYTYATGYAKNWSMAQRGDGSWVLEFDNSDGAWKSLNQTGNVTVRFYIYDTVGNMNATFDPSKNALYVNSSITVSLLNYVENTTYNRGENLTLYALDVNGFLMEGANWTANLTKYGEALSGLSAQGQSYWNTTINASEPAGNWTLFSNASWMGNSGNASFSFNVTDSLDSYFSSPTPGTVYQPNQLIPAYVIVNYSRGGAAAWNVTVNLTCSGSVYTLARANGHYAVNGSDECRAPGSYGTSFTLYANVTCPYNNTNTLESVSLSTAAEDVDGDNNGGNTGGTTGGTALPVCNCTAWVNGACGAGNCTGGEIRQSRVCTPSGCQSEERCVEYPQCSLSGNFNVTAAYPFVAVTQGENVTVLFTLENTGNLPLSFAVRSWLSCCRISYKDTLELKEKEGSDVPIYVHVPVTQAPGEYLLSAGFSAGGIEKNRTVRVVVGKSSAFAALEDMRERIEEMESVLSELEATGLSFSVLKKRVSSAKEALSKAEDMAKEDNQKGLVSAIESASYVFSEASSEMLPARLLGFAYRARMELMEAFVLFVVIVYLLTEVIMPPLTINRQLRKLERKRDELVDARKKAEVQYFKRQIDENTFNKILTERQKDIQLVRAQIEKKVKDAEAPVSSKLSPGALARWLTGGPRRLGRKLRGKKKQDKIMQVQRQLAAAAQGHGKPPGG